METARTSEAAEQVTENASAQESIARYHSPLGASIAWWISSEEAPHPQIFVRFFAHDKQVVSCFLTDRFGVHIGRKDRICKAGENTLVFSLDQPLLPEYKVTLVQADCILVEKVLLPN